MAQVKFYATSAESYASLASKDAGGIYFVEGGELYKGSSRFGANKVWTSKPEENAGVISGDMYVSEGVAEVFNGTSWVGIADANKWTASTYGGEGSYIQSISQSTDGTVTATVVSFPTLATGDGAGQVKLGTTNASVNGWDTLVASVSANASSIASVSTALGSVASRVTDIESIVSTDDGGSVSASTATFTNLTVTDTATFSVTTVSASSLTVNGSTIEQIADSRIAAISSATATSTANGITVSVTTEGGSVTAVELNTEAFSNAMHYRGTASIARDGGTVTVTGDNAANPQSGDIVIDTTSGLEAIYNGSAWELIGDNTVFAVNAYSSTASVFNGVATVPAALNAAGAAIDNLSSTVGAYVGGSSSDSDSGVAVEVSINSTTMAPTVDVTVTSASLSSALGLTAGAFKGVEETTIDASGVDLPTESAVASYVSSAITAAQLVWLDASGSPIA